MTTEKYCCDDFKALVEEGIVELNDWNPRSEGMFVGEKWLIHAYGGIGDISKGENADVYLKNCPRCGAKL